MQSGPPFPFQPRAANQTPPACQANIVTTAAVQQITLPGGPYDSETTARIVNDGGDGLSWAYGSQAGLTVANGCYMLPNTVESFMIPPQVTQFSVIGKAGGSTFRVIVGDGQ